LRARPALITYSFSWRSRARWLSISSTIESGIKISGATVFQADVIIAKLQAARSERKKYIASPHLPFRMHRRRSKVLVRVEIPLVARLNPIPPARCAISRCRRDRSTGIGMIESTRYEIRECTTRRFRQLSQLCARKVHACSSHRNSGTVMDVDIANARMFRRSIQIIPSAIRLIPLHCLEILSIEKRMMPPHCRTRLSANHCPARLTSHYVGSSGGKEEGGCYLWGPWKDRNIDRVIHKSGSRGERSFPPKYRKRESGFTLISPFSAQDESAGAVYGRALIKIIPQSKCLGFFFFFFFFPKRQSHPPVIRSTVVHRGFPFFFLSSLSLSLSFSLFAEGTRRSLKTFQSDAGRPSPSPRRPDSHDGRIFYSSFIRALFARFARVFASTYRSV